MRVTMTAISDISSMAFPLSSPLSMERGGQHGNHQGHSYNLTTPHPHPDMSNQNYLDSLQKTGDCAMLELATAIESSISGVVDHSDLTQLTHLDINHADYKKSAGSFDMHVMATIEQQRKQHQIQHQQNRRFTPSPRAFTEDCEDFQFRPQSSHCDSNSNETFEIKYSHTLSELELASTADRVNGNGVKSMSCSPDSSSHSPRLQEVSDNSVSSGESNERRNSGEQVLTDKRPHLLPPCKVCGSQATGFHYGVNTCEACKGFFRRCLLRKKDTMRCMKGEKCNIRPGRRNLCVLCRYQKCLQAGMSVEGIKTGRYTYKKRTQDIIELQKLRQKECEVMQETTDHVRHSLAMETAMTVIKSQQKNLEDSMQNMHMLYKKEKTPSEHGEEEEILLPDQGSPKEQRLLGLYKSMEKGLIAVVKFAKDLPSFKVLPLADQMKIFKSSTLEVWLIARHRAFDIQSSQFSTVEGYTILLKDILDEEFYDAIKRAVYCLQKLDLTVEETIILKALAYFFTDRCDLSRPDLVEEGQAKIISALEILLKKNHPNDKFMLPKVISALAMLREPSEMFYGNKTTLLQFLDSDVVPLMAEVLKTQ